MSLSGKRWVVGGMSLLSILAILIPFSGLWVSPTLKSVGM
ncbi:KxYKxGKxW signal peptide domain-containing protein [Marinicella sediminis]|uniref:KxYKxGKxW signal peptide domain-containing protein n=1 Tax=Marinicella sediminis TaxID=1792834 RepID=A0ABV7J6Y9_9GAMM